MALDWERIQKKWQDKWLKEKTFEPVLDKSRKKFFVNAPYPYVNSILHIGHLYTYMRAEAFARYKRMQGFNVLFPQAWHATGSPIVSSAKRVKEKEPKQLKILKDIGIQDKEIKKFENPEYWIEFFRPKAVEDFKAMGMSIDWRREFITTSLNPHYNQFIRWQFNKLKEGNFVIKGKFPVVWDPVENCAIGDHDRAEGEGETPKDFIWVKFEMKDSDLILIAGTTRPDALLAQTHLWVDPEAIYKIIKVENEKWVVGEEAVKKIQDQYGKYKVIGDIHAKELMGKWVKGPLVNYNVYVVPGWFIDAKVGSGIVYSALEDPVDLIEVQDIQRDLDRIGRYNLDLGVVKKLKPISIIKVPEMSDNLGQDMIDKYKIQSAKEKNKIKDAKDELNKTVFRKGVMKKNCGKYAGMTVPEAQEVIKKDLIKASQGVMFYELTGKVVSRFLNECIVKIVDDQWFLAYGNEKWKKRVHEALNHLVLHPEKSRAQFEYVIDWLNNWACTREAGLGTRLPWDEQWLIESLSDSTIYTAYYTIAHLIKNVPIDKVDDNLFDYIFLNKNVKTKIDAKAMREEFNYWYPVDFRNSGKDLIQNHLAFFIFNHTAIFPEKHWPKGIGVNGWVTVDGEKMSKSKGNIIPLREMPSKFGVDCARFTILSGGEEMDDPNWDSAFATALRNKLEQFYDFYIENYGKGRKEKLNIDEWMDSRIDEIILKTTEAMDKTLFRSALQASYFELNNAVKWYTRRTKGDYNKETINKMIETQVSLLSPVTPFICEEIWEKIGKTGFVSLANWPKANTKKIDHKLDLGEELVKNTINDIEEITKLAKLNKLTKITLIISPMWKYTLAERVSQEVSKTNNPKEIMTKVMMDPSLKKHGQEIIKLIPKLVKSSVSRLSNQKEEFDYLDQSKKFLEEEFSCKVEIIKAEETNNHKAKSAIPGRVGVLVE